MNTDHENKTRRPTCDSEKTLTLAQATEIAGGKILRGDVNLVISGAAPIGQASESELTFLNSRRRINDLAQSNAVAVVISAELVREFDELESDNQIAAIVVEEVEQSFAHIAKYFRPPIKRERRGIRGGAHVSPTAKLGHDVEIYPGAVVGDDTTIGSGTTIHPNATVMENCRIGSDVTIFPNAVIYENTVIGDRVIIHGNVTIGAYGFGYDSSSGEHQLASQLGNVVIGDDVEIGANSCVDRATYGSTTIGEGTKLDDQVMIGHNCQIGRHNLLVSQVGIAGSTTTGDRVVMAGQVGVAGHLKICDDVTLGAKAGVMHHITEKGTYLGAPAIPVRDQMLLVALNAKLPQMKKQFKEMKSELDQLRKKADEHVSGQSNDQSDNDQRRAA